MRVARVTSPLALNISIRNIASAMVVTIVTSSTTAIPGLVRKATYSHQFPAAKARAATALTMKIMRSENREKPRASSQRFCSMKPEKVRSANFSSPRVDKDANIANVATATLYCPKPSMPRVRARNTPSP